MKKSWKTSAGGIATILAGLGAAITLWMQGNIQEAIATVVAAFATGFGLISARDNKVTSEDVGATDDQPTKP